MWQFVEAILGLVDGCRELGTPVTGGNVSFYNQTGEAAILPTPTVGVLGVIDDVTSRIPAGLGAAGDELWLLGTTRDELSGSVWADVVHGGHLGGMPPAVDLAAEKALAALMHDSQKLVSGARPLTEGGLARALAESAIIAGRGVQADQPRQSRVDATAWWFAESSARILVSVHPDQANAFARAAAAQQVPAVRIGSVVEEPALTLGAERFELAELAEQWRAPLPAVLD